MYTYQYLFKYKYMYRVEALLKKRYIPGGDLGFSDNFISVAATASSITENACKILVKQEENFIILLKNIKKIYIIIISMG